MRIVLDLQGAQTPGSRHRGIGRYSLSLASAMARAAGPEVDLRIALNAAFPEAGEAVIAALAPDLPPSAFSWYHVPQGTYPPPVEGDPMQRVAAEIVRAHHASLRPDAVLTSSVMEGFGTPDYCPAFLDLPETLECAILYDLTPKILAEQFLSFPPHIAFYERQLGTLRRMGLLLAISESSRRDAVRLLDVDPDAVVNIAAAAAGIFREAERLSRSPSLPSGRYVLFAGGVDPNKNARFAVEAFARLPAGLKDRHTLVHVGAMPEDHRAQMQAIARRGGMRDVVFLGPVDDTALINAFDHAEVFVFPSVYEGFGLPVLEAMTRGTPVLASESSSLPEVVGDSEALFVPNDPDSLASRLSALLEDDERRAAAGRIAEERSHAFSWERVGRAALEAIAAAIGPRRAPDPEELESCCRRLARPLVEGARDDACAMVIDGLIESARPGAELGAPRLLVDVTMVELEDQKTGIQRVVRETVDALAGFAQDLQDEVLPITFPQAMPVAAEMSAGRGAAISFRTGDTLLMLDSTWGQYPRFAEHFAAARQARGRIVTAVYDLVPFLHPELVVPGMREVFDAWFRAALIESDGFVCISQAVADEVIGYVERHGLPFRDGLRIGWWHLGSDLRPRAGDDAPRPSLAAFLAESAPTFLMVGTIEPRKRHAVVLDAMEALWAEGSPARLLLVGKAGWADPGFVERLRAHHEGKRLLWVEAATDAEVNAAYLGADALVFASIYEGFGLPIVEAARMGLPTIAADIPVLREVGGDGAAYFPVDDVPALTARLSGFLAGDRPDPGLVRTLSWEESARHLLEVLYEDRWHRVMRNHATTTDPGVDL
jgi:glycosyltransferase involved in cell wall biosynthesis